jgi:hypothetical protein
METRSIAIGLVAVVAAFAAAFGVAKSGGSKTATAGAGVQAETIKVAAPAAVAGVEVGGTLPALKAKRKAPAKKKKKASSGSNTSTTTTPSATPEPSAPSTNNTTPPATNNTTPPANNTPPVSKPKPQPEQPASGGGEDG